MTIEISLPKIVLGAGVLAVLVGAVLLLRDRTAGDEQTSAGENFYYSFDVPGTLSETGSSKESPSPYWWLNSGGYLHIVDGVGMTATGSLPVSDRWRKAYAKNNSLDTDDGAHPQNIFRLVTKGQWKDFRQESYFQVITDNLSSSPNRNESNGLLFFLHYVDHDNLYYAGLRVDGTAVIKKKQNGVYTTLVQAPVFTTRTYDHATEPNLIPKHAWIGIRAEIVNTAAGAVNIKLYLDVTGIGDWQLAAETTDAPSSENQPIVSPGFAGIRTDFMDVEFKNFRIEVL